MCKYINLSKNQNGQIQWCQDCNNFTVNFNNLIMTFTIQSFQSFKNNLTACYAENTKHECYRDKREIVFNTRVEGLRLVFSIDEVGSYLSLMQEAELGMMVSEEK
jgi:hypothetical protein